MDGYAIQVNVVASGFVETGMTAGLPAVVMKEMLGRFGRPEETSGLIRFPMSDRTSYVTVQIFQVDGGEFLYTAILRSRHLRVLRHVTARGRFSCTGGRISEASTASSICPSVGGGAGISCSNSGPGVGRRRTVAGRLRRRAAAGRRARPDRRGVCRRLRIAEAI